MTLNPQSNTDSSVLGGNLIAIEAGVVTNAKPHVSGDDIGHHVQVKPYSMTESVTASIRAGQHGDVAVPTEGQRVIVGYRRDDRPVVLGVEYDENDTVPAFEPGERVVGHPTTSSHIRLSNDGTIEVVGDGGNTVTLASDGTVTINGGNTAPITDISTSEDADGHVTSISLTRADGVYVPSQ